MVAAGDMTDDPQEIKLILQGLESRDEGVRNSVAWKIQRVASGEDELVVAEVVRHLCDAHPPVRRSAFQTLKEVVPRDCDVVLPLLLSRTATAHADARLDVLRALQHFADGERRGDARVIKALVARLNDAEARVRAQALRSLAKCAVVDDDHVVMKVLERLEDVDEHVRAAVAEALSSIASPENPKVLPCLAQLCRNTRPPPQRETLREGACMAIASFCALGDVEGIEIIGECVHPEHLQASKAAMTALRKISKGLDGGSRHSAVEVAVKALCHPELEVRNLATEVLEDLALTRSDTSDPSLLEGQWSGGRIKGSQILWEATEEVSDFELKGRSVIHTRRHKVNSAWARLVTPQCLRWDSGDEWHKIEEELPEALPTLSLAALEASPTPEVVGSAAQADRQDIDADTFPALANEEVSDASYVVAAVAAQFHSQEPAVRKSAVLAIPCVAKSSSSRCRDMAVEVLLPMMQDESVDVRLATVNSLLKVAPKGHYDAIAAMAVRLEDQEVSKDCRHGYSVGMSAARALKKMVTCREDLVKIAQELKFQGPSIRGF